MTRRLGQLQVGDHFRCGPSQPADRYAVVSHMSSGGQVYVRRWRGKKGALERLVAEDDLVEIGHDGLNRGGITYFESQGPRRRKAKS